MNDVSSKPWALSPYARTMLRDFGIVLHVPGLMALASLLVVFLTDDETGYVPFLVTALAAIVVGQILSRVFSREGEPLRIANAMTAAVLAWTITPLFGALPFLISAWMAPDGQAWAHAYAQPLNALFEATSGFTSTGLSMIDRPSTLPASLQWWRSFLQWVGGVGIILATLTVFHPSGDAYRLYFSEGREHTIVDDLTRSVVRMWWIYVLYTLIGAGLLRITGIGGWEALNHAMTAIATGGFSITDDSIAGYGWTSKLVLVIIMILGAISFAAHYRLLTTGKPGFLWKDAEYHAMVLLLGAGFVVLALENIWFLGQPLWVDSLFQWVSALTTSGFSSADIRLWSPSALLLLSAGMVIGGASGATTGGLKLKRVVLIVDAAIARVRGVVQHPWRLMAHRPIVGPDEEAHAKRALEAAGLMAWLWLALLSLGVIALLHFAPTHQPLEHVLLDAASAFGNVGLSTGVSSPDLDWQGKIVLMLLMWLGRLEIVPILVAISVGVKWLEKNAQQMRS